jgi:hypothetical protein
MKTILHSENFSDSYAVIIPVTHVQAGPAQSRDSDPLPNEPERAKFNWIAFIVMLVSIGVALLVGILVPGILDEYIAIIIINLIYGFAQSHGLKTPKK